MTVSALREDREAAEFAISKVEDAPSSRVHQEVTLAPGETYALSFEVAAPLTTQVPGFSGWGRPAASAVQSSINIRREDRWTISSSGAIESKLMDVIQLEGDWERVVAVFEYEGSQPLDLRVGPTPDQRPGVVGSRLLLRRATLTSGSEPAPYTPTYLSDQVRFASAQSILARLEIFGRAWQTFLRSPILGSWEAPADGAAHAHNLILETLRSRGLVGLIALTLVVLALVQLAWPLGTLAIPVLGSILLLNLVDVTFWQPQVFLAAAAWLGWASGAAMARQVKESERA